MVAIGRRGSANAQLLRSRPPYAEWDRKDLDRYIGGPLIVKWGSRYVVGGRHSIPDRGPKTSLCWLVGDELHEFAELPSGGDNSYPGFVEMGPGAPDFLVLEPPRKTSRARPSRRFTWPTLFWKK